MHGIQGKVVLITGASSGIGAATAIILAEAGARVVVGARRLDRLRALTSKILEAGGTSICKQLDVTDRDSNLAFVNSAIAEFGQVDVLVNNAGVMPLSPMAALKVDEWDRMVDVNIKGVLYGIAAVLPVMDRQGFGHIVNISSIGGLQVWPTSAVYSATKYAVRAISDGLRQENDRLRVTCIYPGTVESELASTITDHETAAAMASFRKVSISPQAIGRAIAHAISQPPEVDTSEIVVRPTASPY